MYESREGTKRSQLAAEADLAGVLRDLMMGFLGVGLISIVTLPLMDNVEESELDLSDSGGEVPRSGHRQYLRLGVLSVMEIYRQLTTAKDRFDGQFRESAQQAVRAFLQKTRRRCSLTQGIASHP
jgi:hypothetical protein